MCTVLLLTVQMSLFTSCNDDLAADSYYTFTGEMMSDFLKNREDFSLFKRIVERAGEMDFLSSRGSRTFYPAVNSGVESFLKERGYASVEDLPVELCDTLVKACLVDNSIKYTYNFSETEQINNELDLPLIIVTNGDTVDANGMTLSVINRRSAIINELKNDSVDNGVVHPVDRVLIPNTSLGSSLLDDNHDEFTIYYEALSRTGLLDSLIHYRDDSYEIWKENYPEFKTGIHSGGVFNENDQGYEYHAKRPDHRYQGFTLLIVPDEVLYEKYSDRFNANMTLDQKVDALYDLAVEKYKDNAAANIFGLNEVDPDDSEGRTYKEKYWNKESLTSRYNPLNMFLSYHILDRLFASTLTQIGTEDFNPTWYLVAGIVFAAASFTDFLDGHLARKWNMVTDFGKFADPLADKLLTTVAFIYMLRDGVCSPVVLCIILAREFAVSGLRMVAAGAKDGKVIAANMWGKVKTVLQMLTIIFYYFGTALTWGNSVMIGADCVFLSYWLCWLVAIATAISGIKYLWDNRSFINTAK